MSSGYDEWIEIEDRILQDKEYSKSNLLSELEKKQDTLQSGKPYYRSRLIKKSNERDLNRLLADRNFYGFPASKCGAPAPENVKKNGRCNRINEPVLYLAEDKYTSLAEACPGKRQRVNIAEFRLKKDMRVIDIIYDDKKAIDGLMSWIAFYFYIVYNDNEKYYKISQYITCLIKEMGFDGIRYSSSLSASGLNLVLFDTTVVECLNSKIYQTIALLHYAEEQLPRENNERLLPKSITNAFSNDDIDWFLDKFK